MTQKIEDIKAYSSGLDYTLAEPHPSMVDTDLIGIEIELENAGRITYESTEWENKVDGSLRNNGREFVLRRPLGGARLISAINSITTVLGRYSPDPSWRCSTHIHINVRDLTIRQLKLMLLAYTVYEKVLFKCGSMNRYKNNFCMPYGFAKESLKTMGRYWELSGQSFLRNISGSWCKYSSLNLKPIWNWGSVELRIGNAETDRDRLVGMCNRLMVIKSMAKSWEGECEEFIEMLSQTPFDNVFNKSICLDYEVSSSDIYEGLVNASFVCNYQNMLKEQRRLFSDTFESTASEGYIRDLRAYLVSHSDEDDRDEQTEFFDDLNWSALSIPDIRWLTDNIPISASSLLSASDTDFYNSLSF